jgi:hypothetical protein
MALQVETGSAITWKYPSVVLKGDNSMGEFYSVALTNNRQQADTGTKMIHVGKNTRSRIVSKGISAGQSVNAYRGLVQVQPTAKGARNYSQCDSMLIGDRAGANTYPYITVGVGEAARAGARVYWEKGGWVGVNDWPLLTVGGGGMSGLGKGWRGQGKGAWWLYMHTRSCLSAGFWRLWQLIYMLQGVRSSVSWPSSSASGPPQTGTKQRELSNPCGQQFESPVLKAWSACRSPQVREPSARVEHEASTSKIGEDQLFYFQQRGVDVEDAVGMIISGFCRWAALRGCGGAALLAFACLGVS